MHTVVDGAVSGESAGSVEGAVSAGSGEDTPITGSGEARHSQW